MGVRGTRATMGMIAGFGELSTSLQNGGAGIMNILSQVAYHAELAEVAIAAAAGMAAIKIVGTLYEMSGIKEAIATAGKQMDELAAGVMIDGNVFGVVNERFETLKYQAAHLTEELHRQVPEWVTNATESAATAKALRDLHRRATESAPEEHGVPG